MALLGHTARIIISVSSMSASTDAWQAAGFTVFSEQEGFTRLTDGQLFVTLMSEEFASPALAYFNVDPVRLLNSLRDRGQTTREVSETGFMMDGPGGIEIHIHQRSLEQMTEVTGEQNPLIGYFDALAIGVEDPVATREASERIGFFVQEEFQGDFPQSDVTDGLMNLSFRKQKGRPFLVYRTDLSNDLVEELKESLGDSVQARTKADGTINLITITMPEGTKIMIANEDEGDEE